MRKVLLSAAALAAFAGVSLGSLPAQAQPAGFGYAEAGLIQPVQYRGWHDHRAERHEYRRWRRHEAWRARHYAYHHGFYR